MNGKERDVLGRVVDKLDKINDRSIRTEQLLKDHIKWHDKKWWRVGKYGIGGISLGTIVPYIIEFIKHKFGG